MPEHPRMNCEHEVHGTASVSHRRVAPQRELGVQILGPVDEQVRAEQALGPDGSANGGKHFDVEQLEVSVSSSLELAVLILQDIADKYLPLGAVDGRPVAMGLWFIEVPQVTRK